jgi:MEMO1 family protein
MWFPRDPGALRNMVDASMASATVPRLEGRIVSAISPHAGYVYSGPVAGFTFRALQENAAAGHAPATVVILGFTHRAEFRGIAILDGDAIETPLGPAELDAPAAAVLMQGRPGVFLDASPHAGEHSAENQIPFVQRALPAARLVVALAGDHSERTREDLLAGLMDLSARQSIVVVASSDMLHDADYELVSRTDRATLKAVEAMDHRAVLAGWGYQAQTFCGIVPVVTAMRFAEARGCRKGVVLHYRNSGDDYPESRGRWVVGYGAVVFAAPEA